jgi:hypothetical protein
MPVRKFGSVDEMPARRPLPRLDLDNLRLACELSELAFRLHPWRFEPGVRKFTSAEEAAAERERWRLLQARPPAPRFR